jgi:hypothetical protein
MVRSHFMRILNSKRSKAIPVTGREGHEGCVTLRLPHFLDNRLADGGEVVSLTRRPAVLYLQEHSWSSFLLDAESAQGHNAAGRIRSIEKMQ